MINPRTQSRRGTLDWKFAHKFFWIVFPVICQAIVILLVGQIDIIFVANSFSGNLPGVGVVLEIFQIVITLSMSVAIACSIYVGQYKGQENNFKIQESIRCGWILGIFIVVPSILVLTLAGGALIESILRLDPRYAFSKEQIEAGFNFLSVLAFGLIFQIYAMINYGALQTLGFTNRTLVVSLVAFVVNVVGNYLFVAFASDTLGIVGIAWSTLIARAVEAILVTLVFWQKKVRPYNPFSRPFKVTPTVFFGVQRQFWPILFSNGIYQMLVFINRILIIRYGGTDSYQATVLILIFMSVLYAFWASCSIAVSNFVGPALGSNQSDLAIANSKRITKLFYIMVSFAATIMLILAWTLMDVIYSSVDPAIRFNASWILTFQVIGFLFSSGSVLLIGFLRIGGKSGLAAVVDIAFSTVHQTLLVWMLYKVFSMETRFIFLVMALAEIIQTGLFLLLVLKIKWVRNITKKRTDC
ncbi:MATE family efflux transporter [Mycoplasma sp. ATU-Cv-508]|uniref:MATE family efflux transporter n=1 Tax=Mycoplasma sp. ATU-Cv-508 TaxID=2048001 RepID=UPI0031F30F69